QGRRRLKDEIAPIWRPPSPFPPNRADPGSTYVNPRPNSGLWLTRRADISPSLPKCARFRSDRSEIRLTGRDGTGWDGIGPNGTGRDRTGRRTMYAAPRTTHPL